MLGSWKRFWGAVGFGIAAFRAKWTHGGFAVLQVVSVQEKAGEIVMVSETPIVDPVRPEYVGTQYVIAVAGLAPETYTVAWQAKERMATLRAMDPQPKWVAYRHGVRWDWGPSP